LTSSNKPHSTATGATQVVTSRQYRGFEWSHPRGFAGRRHRLSSMRKKYAEFPIGDPSHSHRTLSASL